ncbi:MAG: Fic family protein [Clostridia bacterium]
MYDVIDSKYTYKGSNVLKNKLNIKDDKILLEYQKRIVSFKLSTINFAELGEKFDAIRLKKIHKYLFEDVFEFAGLYRVENIAKDNFRFSEYIYIEENLNEIMKKIEVKQLKALEFNAFIEKISYFLTELNVLHPFREGNR